MANQIGKRQCALVPLLALALLASQVAARTNPATTAGRHNSHIRDMSTTTSFYKAPEIIQLSWEPRAFLYKNFLSDAEADYLIANAKPNMEKSQVVDNDDGGSLDSDIRTSEGAWIWRGSDPVVDRIEQRIALWTHIPVSHGEHIHVLHYAEGQKYEPHYDSFFDQINVQDGGNRYATVLMYLHTTEFGGETTFPNAEHFDPSLIDNSDKSDCAKDILSVKPSKGDAILFYDFNINGELDKHSLHGACSVVKGNKWAATKWMRLGPTSPSPAETDFESRLAEIGNSCQDASDQCGRWASEGFCELNPTFMVGRVGKPGICRATCKACSSVQVPL